MAMSWAVRGAMARGTRLARTLELNPAVTASNKDVVMAKKKAKAKKKSK
jgi:hypothetical protein